MYIICEICGYDNNFMDVEYCEVCGVELKSISFVIIE